MRNKQIYTTQIELECSTYIRITMQNHSYLHYSEGEYLGLATSEGANHFCDFHKNLNHSVVECKDLQCQN